VNKCCTAVEGGNLPYTLPRHRLSLVVKGSIRPVLVEKPPIDFLFRLAQYNRNYVKLSPEARTELGTSINQLGRERYAYKLFAMLLLIFPCFFKYGVGELVPIAGMKLLLCEIQ
jgi:hypothetical protein